MHPDRAISLLSFAMLAACDPGLHVMTSAPDLGDAATRSDLSVDAGVDDTEPLFDPGPCAASGWCWVTPLPTGNRLEDIWASGPSDIWAVGGAGTIIHYDGSQWRALAAGSPAEREQLIFNAVFGFSPSDVYVVGSGGTMLHFDGSSWMRLDPPTSERLNAIWGTPGDLIVVGGAGNAMHYDEGGWQVRSVTGSNVVSLNDIWGSGSDNVFVVGDQGLIARFDGNSWSPMPSGSTANFSAVWGAGPQAVFVGGYDGQVLGLQDGAWLPLFAVQNSVNDIWGRAADDITIVGWQGVSHYDGTAVTLRLEHASLQAAGGPPGGSVHVVGDGGHLLREQGNTFELLLGSDTVFTDVWARSATEVYLGTREGILRFDGQQLSPVVGISGRVTDLCTEPSGALVAVVDTNEIRRRASDGTWLLVAGSGQLTYPITDLFCCPESENAFASAWSGTIYQVEGTNLITHGPVAAANLKGIWASSATDVYAVGYQGTIAHFDGTGWSDTGNGTTSYTGIWGRSPTEIYLYANNRIFLYDGTQVDPSPSAIAKHSITAMAGDADRLYYFDYWGAIRRREGTEWVGEERLADWGPLAASLTSGGVFAVGHNWFTTRP